MPTKRKQASKSKLQNGDSTSVKSEIMPTKSVGKKRSKVDPLCPKASNCQIYNDVDGAWECMLNQTNIQNNNNKYFLIQLLLDTSGYYYTWFRWGRVGYNGQTNLQSFGKNLDGAKKAFLKKFSDKTRNNWADRGDFVKHSGKYELIEINVGGDDEDDLGTDEPDAKKAKADIKVLESQLDKKVQELINMICDVKTMQQTLMGMDFDTEKSPLGKVTEEQIKSGYEVHKQNYLIP